MTNIDTAPKSMGPKKPINPSKSLGTMISETENIK